MNTICYLLFSLIVGHSGIHPTAIHFVQEHAVLNKNGLQETNSYYGILNYITFNVGYHNEHHDIMTIPGSKLPILHNIANKYYKHLYYDTSFIFSICRFIWDKNINLQTARIFRTKDVFSKNMKHVYQTNDK